MMHGKTIWKPGITEIAKDSSDNVYCPISHELKASRQGQGSGVRGQVIEYNRFFF